MKVAERHRMDRTERRTIGNRLRLARKKTGMTGQAAAQLLQLSEKNTIYYYESGRNLPSLQVFAAMCRLYGTTMDEVWFGVSKTDLANRFGA